MSEVTLSEIHNRRDMVRYFDGYATERMMELEALELKKPLVKTHLLEIQDGEETRGADALTALWAKYGLQLRPLDDSLFFAVDRDGTELGFLERLQSRIVALYSTLKADEITKRVRSLVMKSPDIDHVWLSGLTFNVLWRLVVRLSAPRRFTRIVFTHESVFDVDRTTTDAEEDEPLESGSWKQEEPDAVVERRATSFRLVDRVGVIEKKLGDLQRIYSPLFAISQLRFPSPIGPGGHDFFDNGRVTNRSASFTDHRSHLLLVVRIYQELLKRTEESSWSSLRESVPGPTPFGNVVGAPITILFREPLSPDVFNRWISSTFERHRNRFRLWGHPIRLGPTKVHVYGLDRHLWQPLFLDLTDKRCFAIIPDGTCGNTVHRLVTNIQRYVDPGAEAFMGDKRYEQVVSESTAEVSDELPAE